MNILLTDLDSQYGRNSSLALAEFVQAREQQRLVRVERVALLRESGAIKW